MTMKITLTQAQGIPFNKLSLAQSNVRKIKAGVSIEELAEDIARRGLLQNLHVRPVLDEDGKETGTYDVPAGGRRYQALALLVEQKRLNNTAPVPCIIRDLADGISAEDDSLAENTQRAPLHPLDQFRAFATLREQGQDDEEIAAAFFVSPKVVQQRLKLMSVAPDLLTEYETDEMTLEQLMAFTVNPDHKRQIEVWEAVKDSWSNNAQSIKRMLTETSVRASDKRARFVGEADYVEAGGTILRDLFDDEDSGYWQNVALLEQLVMDKLKACADEVAKDGWKWVAANVEYPYGHTRDYRAVQGTEQPLSDEEVAQETALKAEREKIEAEYEAADEFPIEVAERLDEIEEALYVLAERPLIYSDEDKALAGVFVSLDHSGNLKQDCGWVRPEDEAETGEDGADSAEAGGAPSNGTVIIGDPETEETAAIKPLPEKLVMELTAFRTLALRNAVACDPQVAMTALLHKLVRDLFQHSYNSGACLQASVNEAHFPERGPDLGDCSAGQAIDQRHKDWASTIPQDESELWTWLTDLSDELRLSLLAHCVSFGVNALHERVNPHGAGISASGLTRRMDEAARLSAATGLDLVAAGWTPAADNYLNRVPKPRILEAVEEGAGAQAAQLIDHLKKGDMAKEAERLLEGSGWLPEPLRKGEPETVSADLELPEFLAEDEASVPIAAE